MNFNQLKRLVALSLMLIPFLGTAQKAEDNPLKGKKVLLFTKTKGFRHSSILPGKIAIIGMGYKYGFTVDTTEVAENITDENLKQYQLVIFHNTTGDFLNDDQQKAVENYIHAGGALVGIHAAADAEYKWPWYNKLIGGWFLSHPGIPTRGVPNEQVTTITVVDANNPSTAGLPKTFDKKDEYYDYKEFSPDVKVLLTIDESKYRDSKMNAGANHPISWYHEFEGGRVFYTGLGHTDSSFLDPLFNQHLWGGMRWAASGKKVTASTKAKAK